MKIPKTNTQAKSITVTVERLSDHSRMTFPISSDKTIEHLRSLLNHHLPPTTANQFSLYSFQRGALIHFHPPSFTLDYFPVIFDQSVLHLQMDDRHVTNAGTCSGKSVARSRMKRRPLSFSRLFSWRTPSTNITCLSIWKQIFRHRSRPKNADVDYRDSVLTY